jgi:hypothetical protein
MVYVDKKQFVLNCEIIHTGYLLLAFFGLSRGCVTAQDSNGPAGLTNPMFDVVLPRYHVTDAYGIVILNKILIYRVI